MQHGMPSVRSIGKFPRCLVAFALHGKAKSSCQASLLLALLLQLDRFLIKKCVNVFAAPNQLCKWPVVPTSRHLKKMQLRLLRLPNQSVLAKSVVPLTRYMSHPYPSWELFLQPCQCIAQPDKPCMTAYCTTIPLQSRHFARLCKSLRPGNVYLRSYLSRLQHIGCTVRETHL